MSMVLWVTLDLNDPQRGWISVSQEPLERLLKAMGQSRVSRPLSPLGRGVGVRGANKITTAGRHSPRRQLIDRSHQLHPHLGQASTPFR